MVGRWPLLRVLATEPRSRTILVVFCTVPVGTVDTLPARLDGLPIRVLSKPYVVQELLAEVHAAQDASKPVA